MWEFAWTLLLLASTLIMMFSVRPIHTMKLLQPGLACTCGVLGLTLPVLALLRKPQTLTWSLHLLKNMATLLVQHTVDASKSLFRCLDLHQVHRLTQPGESCELGSIDGSSASGDDLSTTPVNGVCVQHHITHLQDKPEGSAHHQ